MVSIVADGLEVCADCATFLANGELPTEPERETEYLERITAAENRGENLGLWILTCDEDSHIEFSWRKCDLCLSPLGGSRCPAVVFDR